MYPLTIDDNVYLINEDKIIQFKNGDLMVKVIKSEVSLIEAICLAAIEHRPVTILQSYAGGLPNVHWGNRKLNTNDCSYTVDQYAFPVDFSFANLRGDETLFCVFDPSVNKPIYTVCDSFFEDGTFVNLSRVSGVIIKIK